MSNLFKFVAETGVRSDETIEYRIELAREVTVKEVIDEIFNRQNHLREWGILYLNNRGVYFGVELGEFGAGYEPKLEDEVEKFPEWLLNAKVVQMKACGGWSRMDYYIWIYPSKFGIYRGVKTIDDFKEPYDRYLASLNISEVKTKGIKNESE